MKDGSSGCCCGLKILRLNGVYRFCEFNRFGDIVYFCLIAPSGDLFRACPCS
jgi:hypothetical protein